MEEVAICTKLASSSVSEVVLSVNNCTTCREVVRLVEEELEVSFGRGWQLQEDWKGCKRRLHPDELVPLGNVATRLFLCSSSQTKLWSSQILQDSKRAAEVCRGLGRKFRDSPFRFISAMPRSRQLKCVEQHLRNKLDSAHRKYSATLLQRLGTRQPLWGPPEPTLLDNLMLTLSTLEKDNLESSTAISELNMKSVRLLQQVSSLKGRKTQLSGELATLQEEVKRKREERERNAPKNVEQMKTDLANLKKELDTKNQLNSSLNSKLQKLKDHLKIQQKALEERKKQINKLKGLDTETTITSEQLPEEQRPSSGNAEMKDLNANSQATPTKIGVSSNTSKKRHASKFEAKSRKLVEEEGQAFLQLKQPGSKDTKVYSREGSKEKECLPLTNEKLPEAKPKRLTPKRKVRFEPEAIVLNVALEGNLELLKECMKKLDGRGYVNSKGATCLHNAVCSGNFEAVSYLVEQACDINAQDIDGWTPLHCAVAYSNFPVLCYLVEHGASLFLATSDGDTPLQIAQEEYRLGEGQASEIMKAAEKCLHYLTEEEERLGAEKQAYVLFNRHAQDSSELGLTEGERLLIINRDEGQWWMAENGRGQRGAIPSTYVGLYRRVRDTL